MIKFLRINNIALISFAEIELRPGLTLLTGETGAGKSILIDALGLVLGSRASSDLIRTGEESAAVEAIVDDAGLVCELEARGLLPRMLLSCFDDGVLERLRSLSPNARLAVLVSPRAPDAILDRARRVQA